MDLAADDGLLGLAGDSPAPPVNSDDCSLLGSTGLIVQGLMAVIVLTSLVVKRYKEDPPRAWPVWLADISKQVIGQGFLHSTNVLFSMAFAGAAKRNACTAYFLSIFVDCTLGVLIIYATLRIFHHILVDRMRLTGYKSGQYYKKGSRSSSFGENSNGHLSTASIHDEEAQDPETSLRSTEDPQSTAKDRLSTTQKIAASAQGFQMAWWGKQLLIYLATLCIMKITILGFFWIPAVFTAGDWLLSWLNEDTKIIFVLMIFPLLMNALQFLLIDAILKSKPADADSTVEGRSGSDSPHLARDGDDRHHDEEEGRAFLASHQDDLDAPNSPLPSYHSQDAGSTSTSLAHQQQQKPSSGSQLGSLRNNSGGSTAHAIFTVQDTSKGDGWGADSPEYHAASSSSNNVQLSSNKHLGAIPLQMVGQTRRPSEMSIGTTTSQGEKSESEAAGWDWLSDDGAGADGAAEDFEKNSSRNTPIQFEEDRIAQTRLMKTAKVA